MDERGQELTELRDYGHKLLEEMRYPNIIGMLQETISHIADIAEEYSAEAEKWHNKYDECAEQNENLQKQITDLTKIGKQEIEKLRAVIDEQTKKIESMGDEFAKKMDELRSHRNQEIDEYNEKLQALIATQTTLDNLKCEVTEKEGKLEEDRQRCNKEKNNCESKRLEYEQQIEDNQAKLNEYDSLYRFKLEAQQKIDDATQSAETKIKAANDTATEWERKYGEEYTLREKLEKKIESLKNQLQDNAAVSQNTENQSQDEFAETQGEHPNHDEDDEDGTK